MHRRPSLRAAPESPLFRHLKPALLAAIALVAVIVLLARAGDPEAPVYGPDAESAVETSADEEQAQEQDQEQESAPESTIPPSLPVPQGARTVTVVVPDPLGLAVGDTVDVIVTTSVGEAEATPGGATAGDAAGPTVETSARVVRRATVRSIAAQADIPGQVTVSLIVTPDDVGRVELASRAGTLSLSLTPLEDDGVAPTDPLPEPATSVDGGPDPGDDESDDQ